MPEVASSRGSGASPASVAVPFWGWVMIGGAYYVICFAILHRLFLLPPSSPRNVAFGLLGAIMFINALWNYFFFRSRNLFHAFLLGVPYDVLAIALLVVLSRTDPSAALWFAPVHLLFVLRQRLGIPRLEAESSELKDVRRFEGKRIYSTAAINRRTRRKSTGFVATPSFLIAVPTMKPSAFSRNCPIVSAVMPLPMKTGFLEPRV